MFLKNPMVYTQFHPVAYTVKLNIEMTMASLIKRIALASIAERDGLPLSPYTGHYTNQGGANNNTGGGQTERAGNHTFANDNFRKASDVDL
jgi:hypothetical protein